MTEPAKSKEQLRDTALHYCSDFISDWERVFSILDMMEEALNADIHDAGEGQMETTAPEAFALNSYWLRHRLEESAKKARKRLDAVGYSTGPRV